MTISDLKNKMVAVLGYGQEGKAVTNYLEKHGIKYVLFDQRPLEQFEIEAQEALKQKNNSFIFGPDCFKELSGFQVAFRSPGIKLNTPELVKFKDAGLVITSQTKFFFENCPAQIIGVTGTKGKGTTSTLIHQILELAGEKSYLTGNIGQTQAFEILDDLKDSEKIVYELSSFQLQDLSLSPQIAIVLMVTSEHLDYHEGVAEYRTAKETITKYQSEKDIAIINQDFDASKVIGEKSPGKKIFFSTQAQLQEGCWLEDGFIKYSINGNTDSLIETSAVGLRGAHNLENLCAAAATTLAMGIDAETVRKVAKEFKGLEHRLEFVKNVGQVSYYNDSYSTTPETAIAGINSFTEPLICILGGSEKHSDFTELGRRIVLAKNIKKIILIGESAQRIKQAILEAGLDGHIFSEGALDMEQIIEQAKLIAQPGDTVLLSPASASFDMFKNYKHRGEEFKRIVAKLN